MVLKKVFSLHPTGHTDEALEEANLSRERGLQGEPWPSSSFPDLGLVKIGVFFRKLRHRTINVVDNTSLDT